jgi:hypothetical protein
LSRQLPTEPVCLLGEDYVFAEARGSERRRDTSQTASHHEDVGLALFHTLTRSRSGCFGSEAVIHQPGRRTARRLPST